MVEHDILRHGIARRCESFGARIGRHDTVAGFAETARDGIADFPAEAEYGCDGDTHFA